MKIVKGLLLLLVVLAIALSAAVVIRTTPEDLGLPFATHEPTTDQSVQVTWLGVSTLVIDDGTSQLLIDGFFSRPSLLDLIRDANVAPDIGAIEQALDDWQINRLDVVMTVHSHYDHAMDIGVISQLTGAEVMGSASTANVARGADIGEQKIVEVVVGQSYRYGDFTITYYESRHAPLGDDGPPMPGTIAQPLTTPAPISAWKEGGSYSIHIEHPSVSFIVQGSAGFVPGALDHLDVDAVFLGADGLNQFGLKYANDYISELVRAPNAEVVFLTHFEDLTQPLGTVVLPPLGLGMDKTFAFELSQYILPAQTYLMEFGKPVVLSNAPDNP